jgi:hypothetical protein
VFELARGELKQVGAAIHASDDVHFVDELVLRQVEGHDRLDTFEVVWVRRDDGVEVVAEAQHRI